MTTTAKSITFDQIRQLRTEAASAGDFAQVVICDLALDGEVGVDDYCISAREVRDVVAKVGNRDAAYAMCASVITDAAGQL